MQPLFNPQETQDLNQIYGVMCNAYNKMTSFRCEPFMPGSLPGKTLEAWVLFTSEHTAIHDQIMHAMHNLQHADNRIREAKAAGQRYRVDRQLEWNIWNGLDHGRDALEHERVVQAALDRWWGFQTPPEQARLRMEYQWMVNGKPKL